MELAARSYLWKGVASYKRERIAEALASYKVALSYKSDYAEVYYWIGWAHLSREEYWAATSNFNRAVELDPHEKRFREGLQYAKAKRNGEAKEVAKEIAKEATVFVLTRGAGRAFRWFFRFRK